MLRIKYEHQSFLVLDVTSQSLIRKHQEAENLEAKYWKMRYELTMSLIRSMMQEDMGTIVLQHTFNKQLKS